MDRNVVRHIIFVFLGYSERYRVQKRVSEKADKERVTNRNLQSGLECDCGAAVMRHRFFGHLVEMVRELFGRDTQGSVFVLERCLSVVILQCILPKLVQKC